MCSKIFGTASGVVDMLVRFLPSSKAATAAKVERCYTGAENRCFERLTKPLCTARRRGPFGDCAQMMAVRACVRACVQLRWPLFLLPSRLTPPPPPPSSLPAGPQDSTLAEHMRACNPRGPLVVYVCKLFPKTDCSRFDAFGRIMSGTVKPGDRVRGARCACCAVAVAAPAVPVGVMQRVQPGGTVQPGDRVTGWWAQRAWHGP